jgi:hypothetical protein
MSMRDLTEWRAYHDLEPFDEERMDFRFGSIVQAFLNTHGRRKGQPTYQLKDCVLRFGSAAAKPKTVEQARAEVVKTMDLLMLIFNSEPEKASKPRVRRER